MPTTLSRTQYMLDMRHKHVPRGLSVAHPIVVAHTRDSSVWDVEGKEYVDFTSGIGVLNIGHNHRRVVEAVQAQLERFSHVSFQVASYEPYIALAERLNRIAPVPGVAKTLLVTTGVEAVENAIKIARCGTGRPAVIAFQHGFHGRTLLGMSLTGKARPYRQAFGPFAPEIYHAPFPYQYRGWDATRSLAAFDELLQTQVSPDRVAAAIIEPVLGEGGFVPAPAEFLVGLRERADAYGFALIVDEIQSGFGRTGHMFALEHANVEADIVTIAKSLAGGLPLAAVVGRAELMDAPDEGGLGGTYGGNPLACAAALAVLDTFERESVLERAQALGKKLRLALDNAASRHTVIGDVRGLGPMLAIELVRNPTTRDPAPELAQAVAERARELGLLLLTAGTHGNVIRFLAPLLIDDQALGRAIEALEAALADRLPMDGT